MYTGKMDKKRIKSLLKSFKNGATITAACKAADMSACTLWRWCKKWPNLDKRIEELKGRRIGFVVDSIYINAMNGKEGSQKLFCELNGLIKRGGINVSVPVDITNKTNVTIPVATPQEAELIKSYAQLIRSHNLIARTLGEEGHEPILGNRIEGREGEPSQAGGDPSGDSMAH